MQEQLPSVSVTRQLMQQNAGLRYANPTNYQMCVTGELNA